LQFHRPPQVRCYWVTLNSSISRSKVSILHVWMVRPLITYCRVVQPLVQYRACF
jgi:hypothetical protein